MIKKLFFVICTVHLSFAQQSQVSGFKKKYSDYFELPRERVFLHLNKTDYLKDEEIWFTAYLYNTQTGLPFNETTNLYCGLYNSKGALLTKKLFYVTQGKASGSFEIKSNYGSGEIYLKASTKWMENFDEEGSFIQKINLLDSIPSIRQSIEESHDVQLLPEGGYLLAGTSNTIGFKVTNQNGNGKPIAYGKVINHAGETILNQFANSSYGIGKFSFYYKENQQYSLILYFLDGSSIIKEIPQAVETGVVFSVNNLLEDKLAILLKTNAATIPEIENQDFYLAVHRDGLLVMNSFKFEKLEKTVTISKEKLWPGMNILTLFDKNLTPISERLIFNSNGVKIGNLNSEIGRPKGLKDSLKIRIDLYSKSNTSTSLSISVLPEETLTNNPNSSISSTFLLRPYIEEHVENAPYYFRNMNRKKRFELDNLLLVQGWSKYNWDKIFKSPPKQLYRFEKGITIRGSVTNASKKRDKIFLTDPLLNNQYVAKIDDTNHFEISNAILFKDIPIKAMLFDTKGIPSKPEIELKPNVKMKRDSLNISRAIKSRPLAEQVPRESYTNFGDIINEDVIALDNVTVTTKIRNKNFKVLGSQMTGVTLENEKGTISGFLRNLGFRTTLESFIDGSIDGKVYAFKERIDEVFPVPVSIDGVFDLGFYDEPLKDISEIYYRTTLPPLVVIKRKQDKLETIATTLLEEGFERPKQYYNPKFTAYTSQKYKEYGTVHWEPQLLVGKDGKTSFLLPDYGLNSLKLYIEGMAEDGTLFSEIKTVSLN